MGHLHFLGLGAIWFAGVGMLSIAAVWFYHFLMPDSWHFLPHERVEEMKTVLLAGIVFSRFRDYLTSPSYARGHGHRPALAVKQAPLPSARIALCGLIRTRTLSTRCGWMVRAPRAARPAVQGPDFCSWNARRLNSSASGQHEASATRMRLAVSTMRPAIFKRCRRMLVNSLWRSGCQDGT